MRPAGVVRIAARMAALGVLSLCAACHGSFAVSPNSAPPSAPNARTATSAPAAPDNTAVHLAGLLTMKGPEMSAWWAVAEDNGTVWRLEPASAEQAASFRQWQNTRVEIDGLRAGMMLRTPIVKVERARQLR
jgi:mono/diheme cytochrome c family protein